MSSFHDDYYFTLYTEDEDLPGLSPDDDTDTSQTVTVTTPPG
jgi:hypothetical protein